MADETPQALSGFFGGRAASNSSTRADTALDSLATRVERFASILDRAGQSISRGSSSWRGGSQWGNNGGGWSNPGGAHRAPNGGGATFSGAPMGGGSGGGDDEGPGRHRAGSHRASAMERGVPQKAAKVALGGLTAYTALNAPDQYVMQSLASQYAPAGNAGTMSYARSMFGNNYTAANSKDLFQYQLQMRTTGGFTPGSAGYSGYRTIAERMSLVDPTISNTASFNAAQSLASVSSFNKLQGLGITPTDRLGRGDPMSVARQILNRMGSSRVKTVSQVDAAFGPSGSATVTLEGYIANGYLSAEAAGPVRAAMRAILMAQVRGMSYTQLQKDTAAAQKPGQFFGTNEAERARDRLNEIGIGNSLIAGEREREGGRRESQLNTLGGFTKGVELSQETMKQFRDIFNSVLGVGPVGSVLGFASGSQAGGLSGLVTGAAKFLHIPGMGDGPGNMGASQMSYGGRAAGGSHGSFGVSSGGSVSARSTGSAARVSTSGLGPVKPWVASAAQIIASKFGIKSMGGVGDRPTNASSDHPKGLAVDFMCSRSVGNALSAWVVANHKQLNVTYVIWYAKIWSINHPSWRTYHHPSGATDPTSLHMDHVHVSFLASPTNGDVNPSGMTSGGASSGIGGSGTTNNGTSAGFTGGGASTNFASSIGFSELASLGAFAGGVGASGGGSGSLGTSGTSGGSSGGSGGFGSSVSSQPGGGVRTGTYNLWRKTSNEASQKDLAKLMRGADVLSLTEFIGNKRGLASWIQKQGWGLYSAGGSDDTAIIWDKSDYDLVQGGKRNISDSGGHGAFRDRAAAWARLRSKATGAEFYQISGHTVGYAQRGNNGWEAKMREQFAGIKDLVGDLSGNNIPILLAGDFNVNSKRTGISPDFGLSHLAGIGLDRIYGSSGVSSGGSRRVGGLSSDHDAMLASLMLGAVGGGSGGVGGGSPQAIVRSAMKQFGWNQWGSLKQLVQHESGFRPTAQNPSSTAYGMFQFLDSTWAGVGGHKTSDPALQALYGMRYIKNRYGSPDAAWDFWQKNHWYDKGSWSIRADQDARVHQGEMIIPANIAEGVRKSLLGFDRKAVGGSPIVFEKDSVHIHVGAGAPSGIRSQMREAADIFVEQVAQNRRIQALTAGAS